MEFQIEVFVAAVVAIVICSLMIPGVALWKRVAYGFAIASAVVIGQMAIAGKYQSILNQQRDAAYQQQRQATPDSPRQVAQDTLTLLNSLESYAWFPSPGQISPVTWAQRFDLPAQRELSRWPAITSPAYASYQQYDYCRDALSSLMVVKAARTSGQSSDVEQRRSDYWTHLRPACESSLKS